MSALFNFHSFLTVVLLVICTCTYVKMQFPTILEQKTGRSMITGIFTFGGLLCHLPTNAGSEEQLLQGAGDAPAAEATLMAAGVMPPHWRWGCDTTYLCSIFFVVICCMLEVMDPRFRGFFWKAARIGERLSPWVAVGCFTMGISIIIS